MNSFLFTLSVICLVEGFDWCPVVKPKESYEGLGFYRTFDGMGKSKNLMFNRAGKEWTVNIKGSTSEVTLTPVETSVTNVEDKDISNKFGTFALWSKAMKREGGMQRNCLILNEGEFKYRIKCEDVNITGFGHYNFVVVKVKPELTLKETADCLLIRRDKKSNYLTFNPYLKKLLIECTEVKTDRCAVPDFISEIGDDYFNQIDAIVEFSLRGIKGHIILFNIDGRPKYCTTIDGQSLSDECKSPEKLKPLFGECFSGPSVDASNQRVPDVDTEQKADDVQDSGKDNSSSSVTTPTESKSSSVLIFVIIAVVVIIILVIVVVLFIVCGKKKSSTNTSQTDQKPNTTQTDQKPNTTQTDQKPNQTSKNGSKTGSSKK